MSGVDEIEGEGNDDSVECEAIVCCARYKMVGAATGKKKGDGRGESRDVLAET